MEKPAKTTFDIHPIIKKRWSPRAFQSTPIQKETVMRLLEAARWAPSSFNEQPWRFMVGFKSDNTWQRIHDAMVEFNQQWAGNAPVLIMAIGNKISSKGKTNAVYQYDVGQSMAYLTFQATEEGLAAHQMGGFSKEKAIELFDIPEDHEPIALMAIGHQDKPGTLSPDFEKMENAPRARKPLSELVFAGEFGESLT